MRQSLISSFSGHPLPHFYVINLARSKERWAKFTSAPCVSEAMITRIDAIDGHLVAEQDYEGFNIEAFITKNGRQPRPGEYGCYQSHIKALKTFALSPHQTAIICEDDTVLTEQGIQFCTDLDTQSPKTPLLIRLTTHRKALYEPLLNASDDISIGQSWFGPTGSAAAYWLNKAAAEQLLQNIAIGDVPFDIALESAWQHNVPSFITKPNVFPRPTPPSSDINYDKDIRYQKRAFYKRASVLVFRARSIASRVLYSAKTRRFPR